MASGDVPRVIVLWDARTFRKITTLRADTRQVREIAFSRDGRLLTEATYGGPTVIWDMRQLRQTLAEMNLDW